MVHQVYFQKGLEILRLKVINAGIRQIVYSPKSKNTEKGVGEFATQVVKMPPYKNGLNELLVKQPGKRSGGSRLREFLGSSKNNQPRK